MIVHRILATTLPLAIACAVSIASPRAEAHAAAPSGLHIDTFQGVGSAIALPTETVAELTDLARDSRTPIATLLKRYDGLDAYTSVRDKVAADTAETFSAAGFDLTEPHTVFFRFTTAPSEQTLSLLRSLPYKVRVISGSVLNADDASRASEAAASSIRALDDVSGLWVGVDASTGTLRGAYKTDGSALSPDAIAATVRAALTHAGLATPPLNIVQDQTYAAGNEALLKGGHKLTDINDASVYCTSAFAVTVGGVDGIVTAMHCPNSMVYDDGPAGVIQYGNAADHTSDTYYDLQWHRKLGSTTASPKFRNGAGSETTVSYGADADAGAPVCNYGITTNSRQCSTVWSVPETCYSTDLTWCGVSPTNDYITAAGNSGGPWFSGAVARGVHSGWATIDFGKRSMFTRWSYVYSKLHASLYTGSD